MGKKYSEENVTFVSMLQFIFFICLFIMVHFSSVLICILYPLAGLHSDPNRTKLSKADFQCSFGMDEKVNILFCGA